MNINRQNGRRRGRGGGPRSPNMPNPGNRQDNRNRGNAAQLLEKYRTLAREAQLQGDRVQSEYFLQFSDHYFRVLNENRARFDEQRRERNDFAQDLEEEETEVAVAPEGEEREQAEAREERGPREYREERNGEPRRRRGRERHQRADDAEEAAEERISLDVLPPAIAIAVEGSGEAATPPARRARPAQDDSGEADIAPAA